jgi:hypothetical protein
MDNIKFDPREVEWVCTHWVGLAQTKDQWRVFVSTVMKFQVSLNAGKFFNSCTTGGLSRRAQLHGVGND